MENEKEQARLLAHKFKTTHPELVREMEVELLRHKWIAYWQIPVNEDGSIGRWIALGTGGIVKVTAGDLLVYDYYDWPNHRKKGGFDYSIFLPNMAHDDTFNEDERRIGEMFGRYETL